MLSSKERSNLRSLAANIEPITQVGKFGVNDSLIESLDLAIEKRELKQSDEIAILNIAGTSTHHVLFLDSYQNISEIENELKEADAKINHTTLKIIGGHL